MIAFFGLIVPGIALMCVGGFAFGFGCLRLGGAL